MKSLKIILNQLFKSITFNPNYPDSRIKVNLYSCKWDKNGNCKYNHLQTLINHLKNQ